MSLLAHWEPACLCRTVLGTPPNRTRTKKLPSGETVALLVGFSSGHPPKFGLSLLGTVHETTTWIPPDSEQQTRFDQTLRIEPPLGPLLKLPLNQKTREGGGCLKFLAGKGFRADFEAAGKFLTDFPAARNAIPAKVWALSGKENGCWKIDRAFGIAAGFSPPRPPQPSRVLLIIRVFSKYVSWYLRRVQSYIDPCRRYITKICHASGHRRTDTQTLTMRRASVFSTHCNTQAIPAFRCIRMFKSMFLTCACLKGTDTLCSNTKKPMRERFKNMRLDTRLSDCILRVYLQQWECNDSIDGLPS